MLILAIDTAGPDCAAAVTREEAGDAAILARAEERIGRGHAERLMPMIDAVLADARVDFADLGRIAVTVGPGSFTGVRVGIAAARGLALALDIRAVGVGSLQAIALPALRSSAGAGTVVASLDARRGEVYALVQDIHSGETLIEESAWRPADLVERLGSLPRPFVLSGGGSPYFASALGPAATTVTMADSPDIADVARLGLCGGRQSPPVPRYIRGADAKPQRDKALA
jgi:tRNA threonylcarbamoyladenosine biosynthesis protein TsaB